MNISPFYPFARSANKVRKLLKNYKSQNQFLCLWTDVDIPYCVPCLCRLWILSATSSDQFARHCGLSKWLGNMRNDKPLVTYDEWLLQSPIEQFLINTVGNGSIHLIQNFGPVARQSRGQKQNCSWFPLYDLDGLIQTGLYSLLQ